MADDLIKDVLDKVRQADPSFTEEMAKRIEEQVRNEWGGADVYIAKRRIPETAKEQAVKDYLDNKPIPDIQKNKGLSRSTLYRALKKK
jgi:Mor family transcriptional regulator